MDIDEVYKSVGEFGRYQKCLFVVLALTHWFVAFHNVHMVFIGAVPDQFYCVIGDLVQKNACSGNGSICHHFTFGNDPELTSIVTEWGLLCSEEYQSSLVQSIFMGGVLLGALIFGPLSDKFGRRRLLLVTLFGIAFFSTLGAFAQNLKIYTALRFLTGLFDGGAILIDFTLTTEIVGSSKRALVGMLMPAIFALGIMTFSGLAYLVRSWRALTLLVSLPGVFILCMTWFVPESPRWLLSQGDINGAEQVLMNIARRNSGSAPVKTIKLSESATPPGKNYGMIDLITNRTLRNRTMILGYNWLVNSAVYYGLTMSAGDLGDNRYISVFLSALVEMPAYVFAYVILKYVGRRKSISCIMLIGGISCLLILVTPVAWASTIVTLALSGKLAISASFAIAYIYSAELYPTVIRNNGLGLISMCARIGGIIAPGISSMGSVHPTLQFLVFGSMSFSAGILSLFLAETAGKPMPETIEDVDSLEGFTTEVKMAKVSEDQVKLLEDDIVENERMMVEDVQVL